MTAAQYQEVAGKIRDAIRKGTHQPGSYLPTEQTLAEKLGVDRGTVNRAMSVLEAEGRILVHRGKGWQVHPIRDLPITRDATSRYSAEQRAREGARGPFDAEVRRRGHTPRSDTTVHKTARPPANVAEILGVDPKTKSVVARVREMFADDFPVQHAVSYIPRDIADGTRIAERDSGPGGIIDRFAELGHPQDRARERVETRPPTDDEARFLRMAGGQRVHQITHIGYCGDRAVEVCVMVLPAHLWALESEFRIST